MGKTRCTCWRRYLIVPTWGLVGSRRGLVSCTAWGPAEFEGGIVVNILPRL
jgi:hypothetical protein